MSQSGGFSLRALYDALDAQRRARGLSWAAATREMNGTSGRPSGHKMSSSTVMRTRVGAVAEGDGVLQMLRWLGRTPESFMPGHPRSEAPEARLPDIPASQVLRFDTKKLYAELDAQRAARGMTWEQVGQETGLRFSRPAGLSKGGRTIFPQVMRIVAWLGRPAADFMKGSDW